MACTLEQFIRQTIDSGLMPVDEVKSFMLKIPADKRPTKAEQLAKELVLANKLTKYQAAAIFQGKHKGLVLGQYNVLDQIGAGAMGQVFKAQHRRMKRIVAIKALPPTALRSRDAIERFQREAHAAAKLLHPNIVAAYDADECDGVPFIVLEYVDGIDLKTAYQESPLSVAKTLDYIIQAARGLEYAHSQGVVHRDIKPANLLLDKTGVVKILDMGLARIHQEVSLSEGLTRSGEIMGTVDYMSPEQAVNTHEADGRADQYSLGCTLYRLLTGEAVYAGDSMVAKIVAHRKLPIPSLREKRRDVSEEIDAVYQKMLAKDPNDRYPNMTEAIADLEACRDGAATSAAKLRSSQDSISNPELKDFLSSLAANEGESAVRTIQRNMTATTVHEAKSKVRIDVNATPPEEDEDDEPADAAPRSKPGQSKVTPKQLLLIGGAAAGALVLLLGLIIGVWLMFGRGGKKPPPPKPPVVAEPVNPNDLLGQLDLDRDTIAGRLAVRLDGKALVVSKQAKVQLVREIPEQYDLTIVIERKLADPAEAFVIGLPIGGQHRPVTVAWLDGGKYKTGFTNRYVYADPVFTEGKPNTLVCQVRKESVVVERDGEKLIDFQGDVSTLPDSEYWHVPTKESFFLGFSAGEWRVTKWEVTPVKE